MTHEYILTTQRLGLRRWMPSDEAPFIAMNLDHDVMEFFPRTSTRAESIAMIQRIDAFFNEHGYGLYAVELRATREFIGYTGFARPSFDAFFTPCTEIGWRLKRSAWGQGYATEAAAACLQHGFAILGLETVYSFTAVGNVRSRRVMEKIGMQLAGAFDHPKIEAGHVLRPHVLYVATASARP